MDEKAYGRAEQHYADASAQLDAIRAATTLREVERAWALFLIDSQRVFSKLAAGANGRRSTPWYGGVKHDRKTDPLLLYAHQARHADEHGIESGTARRRARAGIRAADPSKPAHVRSIVITDSGMTADLGENAELFSEPAAVTLLPVFNDNRWTSPPETHRGTAFADPSPVTVAAAIVAYLREKLDEAKGLIER